MKYKIKNITKYYNNIKVLENISIDFIENETTCILDHLDVENYLLNIIAGIIDKDEEK